VELHHTRESDLLRVAPSVVLTPSSAESSREVEAAVSTGAQGVVRCVADSHAALTSASASASLFRDESSHMCGGMESMLREFDALLAFSTDPNRSGDVESPPWHAVANLGPRTSSRIEPSRETQFQTQLYAPRSSRIAGFTSSSCAVPRQQQAPVEDLGLDLSWSCDQEEDSRLNIVTNTLHAVVATASLKPNAMQLT
jgi:hypothetical protein